MRKYRIFTLFFLITVATAILFSCSRGDALGLESDALELQSPCGRWKLGGYASSESKQVTIVLGSPSAYYLTLNKDGTFTGTSSTNEIGGKYSYNRGAFSFSQSDFYSTKINDERGYGNLYLNCLFKVNKYRVFTDQLHLYYSDKEYLLFIKPVK